MRARRLHLQFGVGGNEVEVRGEGKGRMSDGGVFGSEVLSCQDLLLFMSKLSLFSQLCELFIFSLLSNMSSHLIHMSVMHKEIGGPLEKLSKRRGERWGKDVHDIVSGDGDAALSLLRFVGLLLSGG